MNSVKSIFECIGVDTREDRSVVANLLGFTRGRIPRDPDTHMAAAVSLSEQIRGLQGKYINLNIIKVGLDQLPEDGKDGALEKIDFAVLVARRTFRQVNLGVGRVNHYVVTAEQADGKDDIGSKSEAKDLWRTWSVRNSGIDVFVVRRISTSAFSGISPLKGSCRKGSKKDGLIGGAINVGLHGRTFAHEIGHFLGLKHNHGKGRGCKKCPKSTAGKANLMTQVRCVKTGCGGGGKLIEATKLTSSQGRTMRSHCSVRPGC